MASVREDADSVICVARILIIVAVRVNSEFGCGLEHHLNMVAQYVVLAGIALIVERWWTQNNCLRHRSRRCKVCSDALVGLG